jgi:transposase
MSHAIQKNTGLNGRQLCERIALSYSTWSRWQGRSRKGLPLLANPGPKKLGSLPFDQLREEVEQLRHGKKRTRGTTSLYHQYKHAISRRDLTSMVVSQREALKKRRRRKWKRVAWKEPNLAWGIDATEYGRDQQGRKLYLVATQDLASRFAFEPLLTLDLSGLDVADHLCKLFTKHGLPLFLKRDNGGIFNHCRVNELLAEHCVIPLNSPAYYAPYNGAIEKGIREMKETLNDCLPGAPETWVPDAITPYALAAVHLRNCRSRRSLAGHTPAESYYHQSRSRFGKRERHATFEWIKNRSNATIKQMEKLNQRSINAAWRHAAESWLRCQGLITLSINGKVLPHLPLNLAS